MKKPIKKISKRVNDYLKDTNNRIILLKKNKQSFLDPERLKFPVIDPFTLKYDCSLLFLALSHARFWEKNGSKSFSKDYYRLIALKAEQLLLQNNCDYEKMKIENIQR